MAKMMPVALYGLKVPAGDVVVSAAQEFAATFRITMAAIDPTASSNQAHPRATLKMYYDPSGPEDQDSEGSDDEDSYLQALQEGLESDGLSDEDGEEEDEDEDEESSDEDEKNGGPSDPSKSPRARKEAAARNLIKALIGQGSGDGTDEEMEDAPPKLNGIAKASKNDKGKGKAKVGDAAEVDEDDDTETDGLEEVVLCTLDPEKLCQQPLDITVPEDQPTYFKVTGSHTVYLTGNYVIPSEDGPVGGSMDPDEYDLSPDEDELGLEEDDSDELDDIEDPRITEVDTEDEEQVPQLIEEKPSKSSASKKGKNKRSVNDLEEESKEGATLDEIISKSLKPEESSTNAEPKLSKKQKKKLKNNAGVAVEAMGNDKEEATEKQRNPSAKVDKKVSFAKDLEQGPSSSQSTAKSAVNGATKSQAKTSEQTSKGSLGVKVVDGVKIDDRKLGTGPQAKKGDNLGLRYIGKLNDGRVFDANKKGAPFRFRLGSKQVIDGWDIGVTGMCVNGERRIVVPANRGYGGKKHGSIPPNSELTFDLKLLEIN